MSKTVMEKAVVLVINTMVFFLIELSIGFSRDGNI